MSNSLATVEVIKDVRKHENAERLDILTVLGYECIVTRDTYKEGDLVILVQPDSVLPVDREWADSYREYVRTRVKAQKLRNVWSFGLIVPISILDVPYHLEVGDDVTYELGITKFEKAEPGMNVRRSTLPYNLPKTDEERWQNFRDPLPFGEVVDVTLKIDGESFTTYCKLNTENEDGYDFGVTSRQQDLKLDLSNKYTDNVSRYDLERKLTLYCIENNVSLALRGEAYGIGSCGKGNNPHSKMERGVKFFSVFNLDTLEYEHKGSKYYYRNVCKDLDLPEIDLLEEDVILTPELIKKYDVDLKVLPNGSNQNFEGVVVKGKDVTFKVINKHYDSKD